MKILCMAEGRRPTMLPYMLEAARTLGKIEIAEGLWDEAETKDFPAVIRRLEVEGPTTVKIPDDFKKHSDADIVIGSFCPFSAEGMDDLQNVKIIGVIGRKGNSGGKQGLPQDSIAKVAAVQGGSNSP